MTLPTRTPAVSGTFYAALPGRLRADVRGFLGEPAPGSGASVPALVAPHAGHVYSGATAGAVFAAARVPATVVLLAPNHTGRVTAVGGGSILLGRAYRTPLGTVDVDEELGRAIMQSAGPLLAEDLVAHAQEHAVEVLLPFVQMRNPGARLVPIVLRWEDWGRARRLAHAIGDAVGTRDDVLVVASSDMNHYESAAVGERKDAIALERMVALDGEGLLDAARREGITMCGRVPAAVACEYARLRGGTMGRVVAYSHSGLVNGDESRVVGYAGVLLGAA